MYYNYAFDVQNNLLGNKTVALRNADCRKPYNACRAYNSRIRPIIGTPTLKSGA